VSGTSIASDRPGSASSGRGNRDFIGVLKRAIKYKMPENDRLVQSGTAQTAARRPPPEPEPIGLTVLYEDEHLIAVDKPPATVVHPTYKNWSGTLLNGLLWHLRESGTSRHGDLQPRIVTRLDKGTSGVVLVAVTADIHARIQRDTAARRVRKQYLAIVRGTPDPVRGSIALPLARSAVDRRRVVVDPSGQESRTDYELLYQSRGMSLVRCELVTGRTHQIRVHMAARGWPLVGDVVYGVPDERIARQALHAWRVTLPHPMSRQVLELEAAPPADMCSLFPTGTLEGAALKLDRSG
jgi:23S rRNA pseudouridine1911/1915/1917 synthase